MDVISELTERGNCVKKFMLCVVLIRMLQGPNSGMIRCSSSHNTDVLTYLDSGDGSEMLAPFEGEISASEEFTFHPRVGFRQIASK